MKTCLLTVAVAAALALAGCDDSPKVDGMGAVLDPMLVDETQDAQIDSAIIRQQALFPYHFVTGSAQCNELGNRDLAVLADHYRQNPGRLTVRCGDAGADLYAARVKAVTESLARMGVAADRVQIVDVAPGGDGMMSDRVIFIIDYKAEVKSLESLQPGPMAAPPQGGSTTGN